MSESTGFVLDVPLLEEVQASDLRFGAVQDRISSLNDQGGFDSDEWALWQDGESCTGHMLTRAGFWMTGIKFSPYQPWYWGRVRDLGPDNVFNIGVSPRSMSAAVSKHGMCRWEAYNPKSPGYDRNGKPPGMARMQAQDADVKLRPIFSSGDRLCERLADSLERKRAVGLVVVVDEAYKNPDGELVGPPSGSGGLHIVGCDQYRKDSDGRIWLREEGSWGIRRGRKWLHPDRVGRSVWACDVEKFEVAA